MLMLMLMLPLPLQIPPLTPLIWEVVLFATQLLAGLIIGYSIWDSRHGSAMIARIHLLMSTQSFYLKEVIYAQGALEAHREVAEERGITELAEQRVRRKIAEIKEEFEEEGVEPPEWEMRGIDHIEVSPETAEEATPGGTPAGPAGSEGPGSGPESTAHAEEREATEYEARRSLMGPAYRLYLPILSAGVLCCLVLIMLNAQRANWVFTVGNCGLLAINAGLWGQAWTHRQAYKRAEADSPGPE